MWALGNNRPNTNPRWTRGQRTTYKTTAMGQPNANQTPEGHADKERYTKPPRWASRTRNQHQTTTQRGVTRPNPSRRVGWAFPRWVRSRVGVALWASFPRGGFAFPASRLGCDLPQYPENFPWEKGNFWTPTPTQPGTRPTKRNHRAKATRTQTHTTPPHNVGRLDRNETTAPRHPGRGIRVVVFVALAPVLAWRGACGLAPRPTPWAGLSRRPPFWPNFPPWPSLLGHPIL